MWQHGEIVVGDDIYVYDAKVYDTGSEWGINNGRISKLAIKLNNEMKLCYERGWLIEPNLLDRPLMFVYAQILAKYME